MNVQQLAGMVDLEHAHIREKGPLLLVVISLASQVSMVSTFSLVL
jgi:hypothetical protein